MIMLSTIILGILLIFLYFSLQTYFTFSSNGMILKNKINYMVVPILIFWLHIRLAVKENNFKGKSKMIFLFFLKYNLSLIFITELILESIAEFEVTGESKFIQKAEVNKASLMERIIEQIRFIFIIPRLTQGYEQVLSF